MAHMCNPSLHEAKIGGMQVRGQPRPKGETCINKNQTYSIRMFLYMQKDVFVGVRGSDLPFSPGQVHTGTVSGITSCMVILIRAASSTAQWDKNSSLVSLCGS